MSFPVELDLDRDSGNLVLHVSSLKIFGDRPVVVPADETQKLRFFSLTSDDVSRDSNYTIQQIEAELQRRGITGANAYRVVRRRNYTLGGRSKTIEEITFQSYRIPEELAQMDRENTVELGCFLTD